MNPSKTLRKIRIFCATPGDVAEERRRLIEIVDEINRHGQLAEKSGILFEVLTWEKGDSHTIARPESMILEQLEPESWDIFIGILWSRFGSHTGVKHLNVGKSFESGTYEEFIEAYSRWQKSGRPQILLYRCERAPENLDDIDVAQYERVKDFFAQLKPDGLYSGFYRTYQTPEDFGLRLHADLNSFIFAYRRKAEQAPAVETRPSASQQNVEQNSKSFSLPVATHLHSDKWTLDDQLGYSLYAQAMAEFIRHKQTDPPLTIGILAPWGQGKTTLMRMLADQIQLGKKSSNSDTTKPPRSKFREFMKWLDDPNLVAPQKLSFPTVWFNAWKFQNSEQVWAGMAHCIISELVKQLPTQVDRERFWLALQVERLDFNAIRSDIHRAVFEKVLPAMVQWLLGFVFILSALFIVAGVSLGNKFGLWGGVSLPLLAFLNRGWVWFKKRKELFDKPLEGKFAQYVQQPDYEGKMGYFSQVETDVRRVFDLLVKEEEPAIVFVDDLDRCSPGKVAEVIEAVNLFLSGDFPNCYFVIGMDAQVVAASLEVAYEKLTVKLEHTTQSYGSLGWYFMDKFIQLPFLIPSLNEEQRKKYLAKLFRQSLEEEKASPEEVAAAEQRINAALEQKGFSASQLVTEVAKESPKILHANPQKFREVQERVIATSAEKFSDDDPEIQNQLLRYAPYLGNTPRTVKRFANLYRFYRFSQWSRQLQGFESATPTALGRWLVLMLRWPQLVRWIQWEGEAPSLNAAEALSKAEAFEKLVDDSATFEEWNKAWQDKKIDKLKLERTPQLYDLLRERQDESERIVNALRLGVW